METRTEERPTTCDDDFFCGECPDCLTGDDPANRPRYDRGTQTDRRLLDIDDPDGHHPSCCGSCDECIRICWGYHGPERRATSQPTEPPEPET